MKFLAIPSEECCKICQHFERGGGHKGVCRIKRAREYIQMKEVFDKNEMHQHPDFLPSGEPWPFHYYPSRNCLMHPDDICDEE